MTRLVHVFLHRPTLRSPAKRAVGDVRPRDDRGDGPHDERFHDVLPNTDPLGWVTERRPGRRYADLLFPDAERRLVIAKASSDDLPLDAALTVSTLRAVLAVRPALAG